MRSHYREGGNRRFLDSPASPLRERARQRCRAFGVAFLVCCWHSSRISSSEYFKHSTVSRSIGGSLC